MIPTRRRVFAILFASVGLLALSLPVFLVSLLIYDQTSESLLFWQTRLGYNGQNVQIPKIRTLYSEGQQNYPIGGRLLRKIHLDELPQLYLVLTGEMHVVGPRPFCLREAHDFLEQYPESMQRYAVKPGLTGLAQVNGLSAETQEQTLRYDLEYCQSYSLALDLKTTVRQLIIVAYDAFLYAEELLSMISTYTISYEGDFN